MKVPVSKDLSSAVKLCGVPSSRLVTVSLSPALTVILSGLNLKFWMVTVCVPAAVGRVLTVVPDGLVDELAPHAPARQTSAATARTHPPRRPAPNTACCGYRGTAGG